MVRHEHTASKLPFLEDKMLEDPFSLIIIFFIAVLCCYFLLFVVLELPDWYSNWKYETFTLPKVCKELSVHLPEKGVFIVNTNQKYPFSIYPQIITIDGQILEGGLIDLGPGDGEYLPLSMISTEINSWDQVETFRIKTSGHLKTCDYEPSE
jgi:hypothetical protein